MGARVSVEPGPGSQPDTASAARGTTPNWQSSSTRWAPTLFVPSSPARPACTSTTAQQGWLPQTSNHRPASPIPSPSTLPSPPRPNHSLRPDLCPAIRLHRYFSFTIHQRTRWIAASMRLSPKRFVHNLLLQACHKTRLRRHDTNAISQRPNGPRNRRGGGDRQRDRNDQPRDGIRKVSSLENRTANTQQTDSAQPSIQVD